MTLLHNPLKYQTYIDVKEEVKEEAKEEVSEMEQADELCLTTFAQLKRLLNIVFLSHDPGKENVYTEQSLTMNSILDFMVHYTNFSNNISLAAFSKWCLEQNLNFMKADNKRRRTEGSRVRARTVYVLKQEYISYIIVKILEQAQA
ncbi:hypothetical protein [Absidia glauca]|uniref:Uncharacterized protein n=1 Tax=Absidia glauca TaxID=4829 RepID=A0A163TCQ7_ABSGL|nr:hypothetical protein [Absidia glauca]